MVTTRSQDKMTFADKIRAKGFSLADCKFVKLNALFPIMLGLAHATWRSGAALASRRPSSARFPSLHHLRSRSSPSSYYPVYAILLSIVR